MVNPAVRVLMQKLVIGMQNNRGFTLIEILVVLLIIGITLGFALLAFGDFGRERRIVVAAEYFLNYVKFAEQQAILENNTLGILMDQSNYQLLRFQPPNQWQRLSNKNVFRQQHFPSNTIIHLDMEKNSGNAQNNMIVINTSGDITPFRLHLGSNEHHDVIRVLGMRDGTVTLQRNKSS